MIKLGEDWYIVIPKERFKQMIKLLGMKSTSRFRRFK